MGPEAGSPADLPCPQCTSTQVKVALNTRSAIFYRCSDCRHAWSAPSATPQSGAIGMRGDTGGRSSHAGRGPAEDWNGAVQGSD